ncbi:MAG: 2-hydroxyacid dehydrogenase [Candidatus Thorarchaeota archaeon]
MVQLKVLVPYSDELADAIRQILGDAATVVTSERTAESMLENADDADVVASVRVPSDFIYNAKNLKMIQTLGAGIDKIDRQAVLRRGDIIVCNNPVNAPEVAEYATMLLLSAAKHIITSDKTLRKGDWTYGWGSPNPNVEIRNKICLIIGLGNIGSEIAKRLKGFDLTLKAVSRTGTSSNLHLVDNIASLEKMKTFVQEADFIILSLPLTDMSREMINEEVISWMKSTAILVNISRGEIVDEGALFQALKEKRIQAAGLDVWWNYPQWGEPEMKMPSLNHPYHELDNVVMSPHRAAYSINTRLAHLGFILDNLQRFVCGNQPLNIVDIRQIGLFDGLYRSGAS